MGLTKIIVTGAGEALKTAWGKVNTFIDDYEAGTNAPDASTTVKGKVELTTEAETIAGTDTARVITPDGLAYTIQRGTMTYVADAEASDTYVIALVPALATYVIGQIISFKANTINTGACTININTLGAKTIKKYHDQDLANGDIEAGQIVTLVYDGTNFQMQSQPGNAQIPTSTFTQDGGIIVGTGAGAYQEETGATLRTSIGVGIIDADGNIIMGDGDYVSTDKIRARDGDGLLLEDDGGNGIEIVDGGIIHMGMQSGCSAYLSANQNIATGTTTLVEFDREEDDPQNEFNISTYTFTADEDGKYQVSALIKYKEDFDDAKYFEIMIKKNDAYYARTLAMVSATAKPGGSISLRMPLVATDTIQIWTLHDNGNNRELDATYCRFSMAKIG